VEKLQKFKWVLVWDLRQAPSISNFFLAESKLTDLIYQGSTIPSAAEDNCSMFINDFIDWK